MDPNTPYYYALSTIAQCAAALAALIGFFGLWQLDRMRDIMREDEDEMISAVLRIFNRAGDLIPIRGRAHFRQRAHELVKGLRSAPSSWVIEGTTLNEPPAKQIIEATLEPTLTHYDALAGRQRRLMCTLSRFLRRTLMILALAIIALAIARALSAWVLTRWILWVLIILASVSLYRSTASVVREAARSTRALLILTTLLALASPALAGPVRCTTYEERTLGRLQTLCDDGTRAVSTWSSTLQRWDTTITASPRQTCTGQLNPRTRQVEVRCR